MVMITFIRGGEVSPNQVILCI